MDTHREACQRQHRVLGHFLAIQAWLQGLDCVVLERQFLEEYLDLERFKSERVKWLIEDLGPWFPHCYQFDKSNSASSLHSLYMSRITIGSWMPAGSMATSTRIKAIARDSSAPRTGILNTKLKIGTNMREIDVVRYLAVLDAGLESPAKFC